MISRQEEHGPLHLAPRISEADKLQTATALHQRGDLNGAKALYEDILATNPDHFDALHLLALVASASKDYAQGETLFLRAISISPGFEVAHANYAAALNEAGRHEEAVASYGRAIAIKPDYVEALRKRSLVLTRLNRFEEAERDLAKVIFCEPQNASAYYSYGNVLLALKRYEDAIRNFEALIHLKPQDANAWNNHGSSLVLIKKHEEAVSSFDKALLLQADHFDALCNRGKALITLNRHEEALASFDTALMLRPQDPYAHSNRGAILHHLSRYNEAVESFETAILIKSDEPEFHQNRGCSLASLDRLEEALVSLNQSIALDPDRSEAYSNRGTAFKSLRQYDKALADYDKAILLAPHSANAFFNRGVLLHEMNRQIEACASYQKAIEISPGDAKSYNNLSASCMYLMRIDEGLRHSAKAIELEPDDPNHYVGMAVLLQFAGRLDEALSFLEKAISLEEGFVRAIFAKSLLLLLQQKFEEGLPLYEWRKETEKKTGVHSFPQPTWTGAQDLRGKTILVTWEQGLGDTIQFCRYIALLNDRGARVLFSPHKALRGLLGTLESKFMIVDQDNLTTDYDYHSSLLSLPLAFKTDLNSIPSAARYLKAQDERVRHWRSRIGAEGFKIGVCWQGSHGKVDIGRSFPLAMFHNLSGIPGVRLISLQKGDGASQLKDLPGDMVVETLGDEFDSGPDAFLDSAAVIECCDLVITSDTSIAHLAGALGARTWMALRYVPEWRWFLDRDDSPWYPSMRLFRQPGVGDWTSVFQQIEVALKALLASRGLALDEAPAPVVVAAPIPGDMPEVAVSWGELIDKITILEIKNARISSSQALSNVRTELHLLRQKADEIVDGKGDVVALKEALSAVNVALWDIEDKIRVKERLQEFDAEFIDLARSVYKTNDQRAALKKQINALLQSRLVEEKSYAHF